MDNEHVKNVSHFGQDVRSVASRLLVRYERPVSAFFVLVGAVLDALFLPRVDASLTPYLLGSYVCAVFVLVALMARIAMHDKGAWQKAHAFLEFSFAIIAGSLVSALFVYYSRDASLASSWPFVTSLALLLLALEGARDRFRKLSIRVTLLYGALFIGMNFLIPLTIGQMGPFVFLLSGATALLLTTCYGLFLSWFAPQAVTPLLRQATIGVVAVTLVLTAMYFGRVIPPIPMSLRVAEVAYSVTRSADGYTLSAPLPRSVSLSDAILGRAYVGADEAPLYLFTAVYAPVRFTSAIVHVWQYKNSAGDWVEKQRITFPVTGGRQEGYRGYSAVGVFPGDWRVRVLTSNGEHLGDKYIVVGTREDSVARTEIYY